MSTIPYAASGFIGGVFAGFFVGAFVYSILHAIYRIWRRRRFKASRPSGVTKVHGQHSNARELPREYAEVPMSALKPPPEDRVDAFRWASENGFGNPASFSPIARSAPIKGERHGPFVVAYGSVAENLRNADDAGIRADGKWFRITGYTRHSDGLHMFDLEEVESRERD